MTTLNLKTTSVAGLATLAGAVVTAAEAKSAVELVEKIKNTNEVVRGAAWQTAADYGAPAIKSLAALMTDQDFEAARAAKRAAWKIVRHAGRPGGDAERKAVTVELLGLLKQPEAPVLREALWMLSEIAGDSAVEPIAALLANKEVREDARAALERIPGDKSIAALKTALETAPEDYKPAIAHSLRVRGVQVEGYPSQKLKPTRSKTMPTA